MSTVTVKVGVDAVTLELPDVAWTPADLGFVSRPFAGDQYVRLEDLGVGNDLRRAVVHPNAAGKVITLPNGLFELSDFNQGEGTFMSGIMSNSDVRANPYKGFYGSGAGTRLRMVPNSSHFTFDSALGSGTSTGARQSLSSMLQFYKVSGGELANLVIEGTPQPHYYHGVRINGDNWNVHHVRFLGAAYGKENSPPGETYSIMFSGKNNVIEDCELDGRRVGQTVPSGSTLVGLTRATNTVAKRVYGHDMVSGFLFVLWEGSTLATTDTWVSRPGTGGEGLNGCHTNHEMNGVGKITHERPHIDLDAAWKNPLIGGRPKYPTLPAARNQGKFPHFVLMQSTPGSPSNPNAYADMTIIDPVFDTWGGIAGGFAIGVDAGVSKTILPKVILNGVTLTPVVRPTWYIDAPAFDPKKNYWLVPLYDNGQNGNVWGK